MKYAILILSLLFALSVINCGNSPPPENSVSPARSIPSVGPKLPGKPKNGGQLGGAEARLSFAELLKTLNEDDKNRFSGLLKALDEGDKLQVGQLLKGLKADDRLRFRELLKSLDDDSRLRFGNLLESLGIDNGAGMGGDNNGDRGGGGERFSFAELLETLNEDDKGRFGNLLKALNADDRFHAVELLKGLKADDRLRFRELLEILDDDSRLRFGNLLESLGDDDRDRRDGDDDRDQQDDDDDRDRRDGDDDRDQQDDDDDRDRRDGDDRDQQDDDRLRVGDRVKVTNTGNLRLFIRDPPRFEKDRRNVIGSAADGATGTILEGPVHRDGFTWWRVEWDANEKVGFNEGVPCCIGWSAEVDGNIKLLTKIK